MLVPTFPVQALSVSDSFRRLRLTRVGSALILVGLFAISTPLRLVADSPFGDGSDGTVVVANDLSLTRDMNYANLIVNPGMLLNTCGFVVRVNGTLINQGIITDFASGGTGGNGGAGGLGGSGYDAGHVPPTPGVSGASGGLPVLAKAGAGGTGGGGGGGGGNGTMSTTSRPAGVTVGPAAPEVKGVALSAFLLRYSTIGESSTPTESPDSRVPQALTDGMSITILSFPMRKICQAAGVVAAPEATAAPVALSVFATAR